MLHHVMFRIQIVMKWWYSPCSDPFEICCSCHDKIHEGPIKAKPGCRAQHLPLTILFSQRHPNL